MNVPEMLVIVLFAISLVFVLPVAKHLTRNLVYPQAARLQRIQNISFWVQVLMVISLGLVGYTLLVFFMGWPWFGDAHARIVISHSHIYTAPAEMPDSIFYLWLVQVAWAGFGYWVVFSLFTLYRRGIFFSAKNVRHIYSLGNYLIVNWAINYQMQGTLRDMDLSLNPLLVGLLIIFVSWIMDEGRKIQEEQELTV
jgi:hypothetical protein